MRERHRRRVDWDEEDRKTERIRRRGFSISLLSALIAGAFIFFAKQSTGTSVDFGPWLIFAVGLAFAIFFTVAVFRRKERLRRKRQELEEEQILRQMTRKRDDQ